MPDDMNPRAAIGHNLPPTLAEELVEETRALKERADALVAAAENATITDDQTAADATTLAGMIADHAGLIDQAREARKAPVLEAGRTIDGHFAAIRMPLAGAEPRKRGGAFQQLVGRIDDYRRRKAAEAEAERRRIEAEAERQRRAAEEAARIARAATEPVQAIAAEIRAEQSAEEAEQLERQAERMAAPTAIASAYGPKAHGRTVWRYEVQDFEEALRHARAIDAASIRAAVEGVIERQIRARVRVFPGVRIYQDSTTVIRR